MSISFPTFSDKEIVTPEKLNAFVQDLEAKFTAGISSADISWPLVADGDLVMGDNDITGCQKFWDVVNAGNYSTFTLAAVAASSNGGVLFIPPNTTVTVDGDTFPSGTYAAIIGCGPSSVLQIASGSTAGWGVRNPAAGQNILFANLTVDGNSVGSTDMLVLRGCASAKILGVNFSGATGAAIKMERLTSDPTNVLIAGCTFAGGGDHDIEATDCDGLTINNCVFSAAGADAIHIDASNTVRDVVIKGNVIKSAVANGIYINGAASSFGSSASNVVVANNSLRSIAADGITVGTTSGYIQYAVISENICNGAGGDAINCWLSNASIVGNACMDATANALDLGSSVDVTVSGNNFADAGGYSVISADTVGCGFYGNDLTNTTTSMSYGTDFGFSGNRGEPEVYFTTGCYTVTLPANRVQKGDIVEATCALNISDGTGDEDFQIFWDGQLVGYTKSGTSTGQRIIISTICVAATAASAASGYYWTKAFTDNRTDISRQGTFSSVAHTGVTSFTLDATGKTFSSAIWSVRITQGEAQE
jgi:hypothetical protein